MITDANGRLTFVSPSAATLLGRNASELLDNTLDHLLIGKAIDRSDTPTPVGTITLLRHRALAEPTMQEVLDALPVLVSFITLDERYARVNQAYESWFGVRGADLVGKKVRQVIGEAAYSALAPHVQRSLAGETFSFEQLKVPYRLGATRDVGVRFIPYRDDDGAVQGYIAALQDITNQRRLEQVTAQLARNEEKLLMVLAASGASAWSIDLRTGHFESDDRYRTAQGLPSDAGLTLDDALARIDPADRGAVRQAIDDAAAGLNGGQLMIERRTLTADGRELWRESRGQVTFAADGAPLVLHGINFDITARKEAERLREQVLDQSRQEQQKLNEIFSQAPAAIALLDGPDHRFSIFNTRYQELIAYRAVVGKTVAEALPEVVAQGFIGILDQVYETGTAFVGKEVWLQLQKTAEQPPEDTCVNFVYQPIRGADGKTHSILAHIVEVTELVRAREAAQDEARLRDRLIASLELTNLELDRFAVIASHDLKAPLRGIAQLAEWIFTDDESKLSDESRSHLQTLQGRVTRMSGLVDGVLHFARTGSASTKVTQVDTRQLALDVVGMLSPPPTVHVEVSPRLPTIRSALIPLQQVLLNLLGNAFKHGGNATLEVKVDAEPIDADAYRFSVSDNGRGIAARDHQRVWELFRTLEGTDKTGGTGIGLAVVKKLVAAQGGTVTLESAEGAGARFSFTWPAASLHAAS